MYSPESMVTRTGWMIDGLDVRLETLGFGSMALSSMMHKQGDRYQDICGGEIGAVFCSLDWRFSSLADPRMVCFSLRDLDEPDHPAVAAAWVGLITRKDGDMGLNLSYAAHPDYEGRGLTKLLSCAALASFIELHREVATPLVFANCEFRVTNRASALLARSIFGPEAHYDQQVIDLRDGPVAYGQLRMSPDDLLERVQGCINDAGDRFTCEEQTAVEVLAERQAA